MDEDYGGEDYDFEDFEEYNEQSPKHKRDGTPHKSPNKKVMTWGEDEGSEDAGGELKNTARIDDGGGLTGQDLESYMKQFSGNENDENSNLEDLACELKPLDGFRPKLDNAEEEELLHKLGYDRSYSNHSSPVNGMYCV